MLILHISDIHFRKGEVGSAMDPNHHLRTTLLRDAKQQCEQLGTAPDAILVSGDIAFSGDREEYQFAQSWFEELCREVGCDVSAISVIPGNHDVQRDIARKPMIQAAHKDIKDTDAHLLNSKLRGYLEDEDTGKQLYGPLENYNNFASQYLCSLMPPNRTQTERRYKLNDGSTLCVTGLNSSFVSSHADKERSLFVDPASFTLTNEYGVTHLVFCHHPYNWLANGHELADHLGDVSQIQLFGHEHTNRIELHRDRVHVAASAAHPDRTERGWEPGYNLLQLSVRSENGERLLDVTAHVRVWQNRPGQFIAKKDKTEDYFFQSIRLEPWEPQKAETSELAGSQPAELTTGPVLSATEEDASMTSLRALSLKYFKLTFSKKLAIAGKLNLLEEDDTKLPDFERFRQVLLRAHERGLLGEFESEIDKFDA
ncbi:metallophosphoesterase [Phaeobacter gallaeciensis]|uniref:metallophosphoesterase n=1 Tax=Phaeobacter gallaeciensis TaxID=60890 RepID=UPI00237F1E7E|nr:metallophosphoesterase [Phaeobacter gallaeciensis]MDE4139997.1 metallophosphoesterase [Phaeobacter gallaeciensis]MDE4148393.1 metallophosphoesterase [Phaeobacter gallaeciensis]MDE4152663.1 metallophosphoesterase [Phaeobacter gallaeciensis]MDE4228003.1 metallophosphoesterase [Phaeobacter gallaeciensis]MDE4257128.1 metallophosphoesterase [Phaeobacter gallaeciensis]